MLDALTIEVFLSRYAAAWARNDASLLETFWDIEDQNPVYLAEEIDAPLTNWQQIQAYWANNEKMHRKIRLRFDEIFVKSLGEHKAQSIFQMDWVLAFNNGQSKAMAGHNRVSALFSAKNGELKLTSWVEAPLAPITYFRKRYEDAVPAGFLDS